MRFLMVVNKVLGYPFVFAGGLAVGVTIFLFWILPQFCQDAMVKAELVLEGWTRSAKNEGLTGLFRFIRDLIIGE
jgi:hypothetical protein